MNARRGCIEIPVHIRGVDDAFSIIVGKKNRRRVCIGFQVIRAEQHLFSKIVDRKYCQSERDPAIMVIADDRRI